MYPPTKGEERDGQAVNNNGAEDHESDYRLNTSSEELLRVRGWVFWRFELLGGKSRYEHGACTGGKCK